MPASRTTLPLGVALLLTHAIAAQATTWRHIKTTSPALAYYELAFDSARQRAVLVGQGAGTMQTWEWDGVRWTLKRPAVSPSRRAVFAMTYDAGRRRVVLFGGNLYGTQRAGSDTWEWDGSNWTERKPANAPSARPFATMTYDAFRRRVVLFGGDYSALADTWEWDGTNWSKRKPVTSPPGRFTTTMAYDSARRRVVMFGGSSPAGVLGDTWEWDGANWSQRTSNPAPSARSGAAMVYDTARRRCVLFGGGSNVLTFLDDTWEWNGALWTRVTPATSPGTRGFATVGYDSIRQRTVLYGGMYCYRGSVIRCVTLGDTWEYGPPGMTLGTNVSALPIATGGTQAFSIRAGREFANQSYWLFGSISGTKPGLVFEGFHIPLVPDIYTSVVVMATNGREFSGFRGRLDASGSATARLNVPGKLPIPTGFSFHHAFVVFDQVTGRLFSISNPVSLRMQ